MVAVPQRSSLTPAQYLARERRAEYRSEFVNGEIVAMAGGTRTHGRISISLARLVGNHLAGAPGEPFGSDMRVSVADAEAYFYPDLSVACGPVFEDADQDTLVNPTVIVEVLSPSTEAFDRGAKFQHCRRLASLQDYMLVSQERPLVEVFSRQGEQWLLTTYGGLDGVAEVPAIGARLPLREIYERVEWPAGGSLPAPSEPEQSEEAG